MSTATVSQEPGVETAIMQAAVIQAQKEFESARLTKGRAQDEADKAQKLVEFLDEVRRKHFAEEPSISKILPDHPRVVGWQSEKDAIQKLYTDAVTDRNRKMGLRGEAEKNEKAANVKLAQCRLASAHEEIEIFKPKLLELNAQRQGAETTRTALQNSIINLRNEVARLRPPGLDCMLECDPKRKEFERESAPWVAKLTELTKELHSLASPDLLEIKRLSEHVDKLENYTIPNLERFIAGGELGHPGGGVYRVAI